MTNSQLSRVLVALLAAVLAGSPTTLAETDESTRVTDEDHHVRRGSRSYPYRGKSQYILEELDLRPGDAVVDIGAGTGWWTQRLADAVGEDGTVYATEITEEKVQSLEEELVDTPQVEVSLTAKDSTGLSVDTCDLAFFSQVYHHLPEGGKVEYLEHLREVVRPLGRLVVIEKHPLIATEHQQHGTRLSALLRHAEEAGWVPVRCELMRGAYHYMAIFVQEDLFPPESERVADGTADAPAEKTFEDVSVDRAAELVDSRQDVVVLDVRTPGEYADGHIPDAVNLDFLDDQFTSRLRLLEKDQPYLIHCASGNRSSQAKQMMEELGFQKVYHLEDGFNGWEAAERAVEKGEEE